MIKDLIKVVYTLVTLIVISVMNNLFALGPPAVGGGPPCWPPPCVPIDGGISFLLAAGFLYGGKKIYDISKDV